ncbi:MAG: hypothetical protein J6Y57_02160 [Lachnospiraceae bacterium]|nr:hypothetical protein [Lachnospiraceae bacterium]
MDNSIMKIMQTYGTTAEQAAGAICRVMKLLGPLGEREIELIKANPRLNIFQKWRLIRQIRGNI